MNPESERVRGILNTISTIKFRTNRPGEDRLVLKQDAMWFVWSTDIKHPRVIGPLKAAWGGRDGGIWLETSEVDDMMSLVEREYGEKGVHRMPDAGRGVPPGGGIPDEVMKFPVVVTMLHNCEKRVAEISEEAGIPLKILYDGGAGVTTFRIGAKIESPPADEEALKLKMIMTAAVLKEAHHAVLRIIWPPELDIP
jgi:hypothetical protein